MYLEPHFLSWAENENFKGGKDVGGNEVGGNDVGGNDVGAGVGDLDHNGLSPGVLAGI